MRATYKNEQIKLMITIRSNNMIYGISNKKGNKKVYTLTPRTLLVYEKKLSEIFGNINMLVVDAKDGYSVLPMLRRGHNVECYETNDILINGGVIDGFKTNGLISKIINEKLEHNFKLYKENFYDCRVKKEYDFVYSYRSLHLKENSDIPKYRKIRKLQSSVKEGGYIYIFYYMYDSDNLNNENSYFKSYEMKSYFDTDKWDILYCIENHKRVHGPHIYNNKVHYHKTGTIFAKKKYSRRKSVCKYHYNIKFF